MRSESPESTDSPGSTARGFGTVRIQSVVGRCCALVAAAVLVFTLGCEGKPAQPTFSLAWSEYPSWSVFDVAHRQGLLDAAEGKLGELEKKWGVDVVLNVATYDSCLTMYGSGTVDAVCITNIDILSPATTKDSVAILPTSTSYGADACVVHGVEQVQDLRGVEVRGLEKSVSQYTFVRNLELRGEKEADYNFVNQDPDAAATAMQTRDDVKAIVVWNPMLLQTLRKKPGTKVLFDSTKIPEEIIDMVVVSKASLQKPGGDKFACAIIDAFYTISDRIEAKETRDKTLKGISDKFAPEFTVQDMQKIVEQTRFYKTPASGIKLFTGSKIQSTMEVVVKFCSEHGMITNPPSMEWGKGKSAQLHFEPTYMEQVQAKR